MATTCLKKRGLLVMGRNEVAKPKEAKIIATGIKFPVSVIVSSVDDAKV